MKRLSEGPTYPGRVCPHTAPEDGVVCCEACAHPNHVRRFLSRKLIRSPRRLHEVQRQAQEGNERNLRKRPPRVLR